MFNPKLLIYPSQPLFLFGNQFIFYICESVSFFVNKFIFLRFHI